MLFPTNKPGVGGALQTETPGALRGRARDAGGGSRNARRRGSAAAAPPEQTVPAGRKQGDKGNVKLARFGEKSQEVPFAYCTDGKTEAKNRPILGRLRHWPPRSPRTAPLKLRGSSKQGVVSASASVSQSDSPNGPRDPLFPSAQGGLEPLTQLSPRSRESRERRSGDGRRSSARRAALWGL